jgi:hypothetical protein
MREPKIYEIDFAELNRNYFDALERSRAILRGDYASPKPEPKPEPKPKGKTKIESDLPGRGAVGGAVLGGIAGVLCVAGALCAPALIPVFVAGGIVGGLIGGSQDAKDKAEKIPAPDSDEVRRLAADARAKGKRGFKMTQELVEHNGGILFSGSSVKRIDEFKVD